MALLDDLVGKYAATDLADIFQEVDKTDKRAVDLMRIDHDYYIHLKEVTLAQWLLESGRGTSRLAIEATNFAGLKWRDEMVVFANKKNIQVPSELKPEDFCQFTDLNKFIHGYWKFLTRSPYKDLEANTKRPENFIGFIQSKGFSTDINYITKVLKLIPEANERLAKASGIIISPPPNTLQVTSFPQEVEVGQTFRVEGTASLSDRGKKLSILIDEKFPVDDVVIGEDGKWEWNFVFRQAGDRKIKISLGNDNQEINIQASDASIDIDTGAVKINLNGSVGSGGINNQQDRIAVKRRLHSLGFTFVGDSDDPALNTGFIHAIKLFQSIITGKSNVAGDGRVDVGGITHLWLQAANTPRWQTMPNSNLDISFRNREKEEADDHDFGTSWLADTILAIAKDYHTTYRIANPGAAPFTINDVSRPNGGDTPDHSGHETGLMCDVFLPRKDGKAGGIDMNSPNFDLNATRALIQSMRRQKLVRKILFNHPKLIGEGLCKFAPLHHHHIHFEINPPVRKSM